MVNGLNSTDFENLFDVYSSDEITTMQILTADNMQKLVEFYKKRVFQNTVQKKEIRENLNKGKIVLIWFFFILLASL